MTDLWGDDFSEITIKAPVTILREQAALLGQKTKGLIIGKVSTLLTENFEKLSYSFSFSIPALDNYTYGLFSVSHSVTELYPVTFTLGYDIAKDITIEKEKKKVNVHTTICSVEAEDESEFEIILSQIFKSQKTKKVLGSLLAQVSEPAI